MLVFRLGYHLKLMVFLMVFFNLVNVYPSNQIKDADLIDYLFFKAARYSRITEFSVHQIPNIYLVSKNELMNTVCPENPTDCDNLAAVFDDIEYKILVRDDFQVTQNFRPFDYSFVIHELVHSLQYLKNGPEIFNGCLAIYNTEKQAYAAQDMYLKDEGEFYRASGTLKFFYCDEEKAIQDYQKSKKHWDSKHKN